MAPVPAAYETDISAVGGIVLTTAFTAGIPEAIVSCLVVAAVCQAAKRFFVK